MKYKEAKERREEMSHIIGRVNSKGFQITKILIVPSDEHKRNRYFQSYIFNHNEEICIAPYITDDVQLWGIDENYLIKSNVLFYEIIEK